MVGKPGNQTGARRHRAARRRAITGVYALLAMGLAAPAALAQVSFSGPTSFAVGSGPNSVAVGDLNRDGHPDLVTSNRTSDNVSVLLGDGAGSFGGATNFGTAADPSSVAIGDLNGDGHDDLATADTVSGKVSALLGDGTGGFGAAANFSTGQFSAIDLPVDVAIGDLNGDGHPDLATANSELGGGGDVSVLLGDGTGGFGAATIFDVGGFNGAATPEALAIGDLNGDGHADLAVANANLTNVPSGSVAVLLGDGTGGFGAATNLGTGADPGSVAIGDLNGDGHPDLAVTNTNSDNVSVLLGDGTGGFGAATNFATGGQPISVAVGDLDRDGHPDLAIANLGSDSVSVLLGDGSGGFVAATNFAAGTEPISLAIGDLDGDGHPDLAVANVGSNTVSVLLNSDPPITAQGATVSATEGASFTGNVATFTDPDTSASAGEYSATIDWGDGTTSSSTIGGSGGSFTVSGTHTYDDEGSFKVNATIIDTDNTSNQTTVTDSATVNDATLTPGSVSSPGSLSGQSVSLTAGFTDANASTSSTADFTTATIDWGDGNTSNGTISGTGGAYSVTGSHVYTGTGNYTINVNVADDGGSTVDEQKTVLIYATAKGGSFVISSKKTANGTAVYFWGSQWAKNNPLSASAPTAFKGFEDQPSLPSCGQGWKTNPGNSVPPPAGPLPTYMAVIASSKITGSPNNAISGDTVSEVVVKTNPGYGPAPSTPGTGTVVATICP